jgi:hypothetical protein
MANPVTNVMNNVKAHLPGLNGSSSKPSQEIKFAGHPHKPEGGCQGCKNCGSCGKTKEQGQKIDVRG